MPAKQARGWRRHRVVRLAAAGLAVSALVASQAAAHHSASPSPDPAASLRRNDKSTVVGLHFQGQNDARLDSAKVVFGAPPGRVGAPPQLRVEVSNDRSAVVQSFPAWHPTWVFVESDANGGGHLQIADQAAGTFAFPFAPDQRSLRVVNLETGRDVGVYELGPAVLQFCRQLPADTDCKTDVAVSKSDDRDPAVAGESLTYTLSVTNNGSKPAQALRLIDTLPAGLQLQPGSACSLSGATVSCDLGYLRVGETRDVVLSARVAADLVHQAGRPVTVSNEGRVENQAGTDTNTGNDIAREDTRVVARADLEVLATRPRESLTQVLIGKTYPVTIDTAVTSHGPSSPMDAAVRTAAAASAGAQASPTTNAPVPALSKGERRDVSSSFTISCEQPGTHSFSFTTEILPTRPDDADPNASNNRRVSSFDVDCVIPVALNVKPGSLENPINLGSSGVTPTAVLTTGVGQYGLPLPVDATRIDPLSVRFGPAAAVWEERGGAPEAHGRGHPEDSYELDERTRDRDADMVLHFSTQETGLTPDSPPACVKGILLGPNSERWRFFGCDTVRYVPR
ncbi:MAG TPA: DUF11 domain-containing protein [Acidimicrobiales bacterium]|nr:DUF11 domain-containing protein [Acidimicrobiales bacterium]